MQPPFCYPKHYLFKLCALRHFLQPPNCFCGSHVHFLHFFSPPFREQVCWNCIHVKSHQCQLPYSLHHRLWVHFLPWDCIGSLCWILCHSRQVLSKSSAFHDVVPGSILFVFKCLTCCLAIVTLIFLDYVYISKWWIVLCACTAFISIDYLLILVSSANFTSNDSMFAYRWLMKMLNVVDY